LKKKSKNVYSPKELLQFNIFILYLLSAK
jgi:hypothetical protein